MTEQFDFHVYLAQATRMHPAETPIVSSPVLDRRAGAEPRLSTQIQMAADLLETHLYAGLPSLAKADIANLIRKLKKEGK